MAERATAMITATSGRVGNAANQRPEEAQGGIRRQLLPNRDRDNSDLNGVDVDLQPAHPQRQKKHHRVSDQSSLPLPPPPAFHRVRAFTTAGLTRIAVLPTPLSSSPSLSPARASLLHPSKAVTLPSAALTRLDLHLDDWALGEDKSNLHPHLDQTFTAPSRLLGHGNGSMLVAPRELSPALSRHAASHDAASLEQHLAPSSSSPDMKAAIPSTISAHNSTAPAEMAAETAPSSLPNLQNHTKEPISDVKTAPLSLPEEPSANADQPGVLDQPSAPIPASSTVDAAPMMAPAMAALDPAIPLPENLSMGMQPDLSMMPDMEVDMNSLVPPQGEQRLSAFARLRFDDGSYYMHTYQIILGRNVQLAHKDMRRFARADQLKAKGESHRAEALLNRKRRKQNRDGPKSVISEAGGIVNAPIKMMPAEYRQRHQSVASHAPSAGSHPPNEDAREELEHAPQNVIMQAFPEAPDTFDSYVPEDPNDCPLVPIHPQHITDRTGAHGPKGISRQHAKIFYDFDQGNFRLKVLGTNGLHHEGVFLDKDAEVELCHGDTILIGMVEMTFFLPDIALTEEQRNREQGSGSQSRPMSFSFENGQGESEDMDDSASDGEMSINPRHVYHQPHLMFDSDDEGVGDDDDMDDLDDDEEQYSPVPRPRPSIKLKLKTRKPLPPPKPAKPSKSSKSAHKRKHERERSPDEPPPKKVKVKMKESHREQRAHDKEKERDKEREKEKGKATKIPSKAPTKIPSKIPSKAPTKSTKETKEDEEVPKATSLPPDTVEHTPSVKPESPLATRTPELPKLDLADGDLEGIITAEIAKRHNLPESLIGQPLEKRKGPGRPPKDGVMSKRQRSQLVKRGKEIERAQAAGIDPADLPQPVTKPKPPRRKESNADDDDVRETTERADASATPGDKKPPKPSKPARTPSPEMRIEDFTEEQLARPTSNYVVLIHEAISSSASGQMNLQQIYNYIEKTYPWYKFKTTTSGWQSSVRHNLGQHDAFVKGDKEGKGYMWRINPNVSIEKERRKRQVSPPQVNHAQRQGYYHPPNAYQHYGQPGYYPGIPPHGMPPGGPPRPPPNEPPQPRLPPSMARNVGSSTAAPAPSGPAPSPYASPWAGGNTAGSPPMHTHPRPYHPPNPTPASSSSHPSGQYGVLYPTTAPPASYGSQAAPGAYGNHYATAGPSPYGPPPNRPYMPYSPQPSGSVAPSPPVPNASSRPSLAPQAQAQSQAPHHDNSGIPHPSGRYPLSTDPELIRQLEAFRTVYLQTRIEPGEDLKVNNAIRAFVTPELTACLTVPEQNLLKSIKTIPKLRELMGQKEGLPSGKEGDVKPVNGSATSGSSTVKPEEAAPSATVAAIAAVAAANTVPNTTSSSTAAASTEPHPFIPNMTPQTPSVSTALPQPSTSAISGITSAAGPARVQAQRPSVEPLTPVPGSPAVQVTPHAKIPAPSTPQRVSEDTTSGAQEAPRPTAESDAKPAVNLDAKPVMDSDAKPVVDSDAKPVVDSDAKSSVPPVTSQQDATTKQE